MSSPDYNYSIFKYNGSQIRILYGGKTLFVKYKGTTPFGLVENFDKEGNYQGTSM